MKNFSKFLEEITIKGNSGVPGEDDKSEKPYLRGVDDKGAQKISGVRDPRPLFMEIMQLVGKAKSLSSGKNKELEEFAEKIIRDVYSGILDNVELDIKLVGDGQEIQEFMQEEDKRKDEEAQEQDEDDEKESQDEDETPTTIVSTDRDLKLEVDKRKLANNIIQGEAKNTKNIIEMPECRDGLKSILGDTKGQELHTTLLKICKIADQLDWIIAVDVKANMMEHNPAGMAGACSVDYSGCDGDSCKKKAGDILKSLEDGEDVEDMGEEVEELFSEGKPKIKVRGMDFSMLLHETVKGIYELIARAGLPKDETLTRNVMLNTSSFSDEAEDFKYGPYIAADLRDFINKNNNVDKYPNVRENVFGKLMLLPADEFLSSMKNILLESPEGRQIIDNLIDEVISELDEYEGQMRDYDYKQALGEKGEESNDDDETKDVPEWWKEEGGKGDIDSIISKSNKPVEYSEMGQKELQTEIDNALDSGDYEKVKKISKYLKEGREIYLKELQRINERHNSKNR